MTLLSIPGWWGRQLPVVLGLAMGLLSLTGCSPGSHAVNVPVSSWPGYEYFFLAQQKGLAERHNLKLTTSQFSDPQEIVHAYLRGEIPIAQLTTVELVDICGRVPERCPQVVLILDESRGADILAARRDVGSVKALAGQTIGMTFSTLGPYFVSRALQRSGLTLDQVVIRNMPLAEMPEALAKGTVDAVAFFPPFSDAALRSGHSRVLFDSRQIPGEIFDVLVVDPAYLKQHFVAITKLLSTWQDAHDYAKFHPREALILMARRQNVSVQEFQAAERGLVYFSLAEQMALLAPGGVMERNLKAVQQVQQQLKLVRPDAPLPQVNARVVQEAGR
ncbi:ABC transporter substrate-binding protein [Cyanobium sp. FACHB-13342]|uniref:ABC transporter substrate-binding protein n=1 Tax=Cyanobium sp. FACHB-13342 TaxID=2692793 RepID=UPI001F55023B|nr:ABC transporter substrate-binding protein [Cyanobium sp. FACHB-13342]